jgi:hypothetical protein
VRADWTVATSELDKALMLMISRLELVRSFYNDKRKLMSYFETIHKANGRQRTGL